MVSISGATMDLDEIGAILDIPIVLSSTDQDAAAEELSPGLSLVSVSVPLQVALRSNPDVNVILDSGSIDQLVIDAPSREQILFATDYSPKGCLAAVAELEPEVRAPYQTAARTVALAVRLTGWQFRNSWSCNVQEPWCFVCPGSVAPVSRRLLGS
jgi:hypothetical protein